MTATPDGRPAGPAELAGLAGLAELARLAEPAGGQRYRPGRRRFLALCASGVASAHLAACGVGGGSSAEARDVLRAAYGQPVTDLDPFAPDTTVDEATLIVKRLVFDTLTRRVGERLRPGLAHDWEQPNDTTWVFRLREGVRFHDGRQLTATDVVASVERMRAVLSAQTPLWEPVVRTVAEDEHTVRFETDGPLGTLPVNLTLLFIVPAELVEDPVLSTAPVGSGPFRVTAFTPSADLRLERFDGYWGRPAASRAIEMPYIAEVSSAITTLRNDETDLLWPIPPDQLPEVADAPGLRVSSRPGWTYFLTWFNCGREPFTDPRVRRALVQAVDIETIVRELYGEGAEPMRAPIPSSVLGYARQPAYAYRPDLARRTLRSLGHDRIRSSMMWFDATGPLARELALAMIASWAEIGVIVEPQSIEKALWLVRLNSLDWDINLQTNTVTTGDADFVLGRLYTSDAKRLGYANPELDRLLVRARGVSDTAERQRLYSRACELIWRDAVGIFPATLRTTYGLRTDLEGFVPSPSGQPDLRPVRRRDEPADRSGGGR